MKVMVFDVGGTEIKYSVMDEQLNRADAGSVPTPGDTQEHFLATLEALYRPHAAEVDGIAMSLPGFIDAEHGVVRGGGAPSLLYNIGTPVGPRLAQRCGCRVFLENDGKAAAIAELQQGALKGCTNGAVFVIGTGVGGGLVINGQLVRGIHCTAGEYSYLHTNADDWRNGDKTVALQCSVTNLLRWYRARKHLPETAPLNGRLFFEAANAGEPEALEVLHRLCKAVDVQIYNLTVLLDLEVVAIGGGHQPPAPAAPDAERHLRAGNYHRPPLQRGAGPQPAPPRPSSPAASTTKPIRWERCWVIERVAKQQPPFEADSKGGCCFISFFSRGTCLLPAVPLPA